jgi:hypothetical protein
MMKRVAFHDAVPIRSREELTEVALRLLDKLERGFSPAVTDGAVTHKCGWYIEEHELVGPFGNRAWMCPPEEGFDPVFLRQQDQLRMLRQMNHQRSVRLRNDLSSVLGEPRA